MLEMMTTLFCVILMALSLAVWKLKRGASEPPPPLPGRRKQKTNWCEFVISLAEYMRFGIAYRFPQVAQANYVRESKFWLVID